jgi:hypothetical protein
MGWRFRRVFSSGPFRWTMSKRGVGWSIGIPGLRYGISPTGSRYISFGIPGTGLYYIKYLDRKIPASGIPTQTPAQQNQLPQTPAATPSSGQPWWKQKNISDWKTTKKS